MPGPGAVLDANVLFSFQLRNFLFHLAAAGLYRPVWSDDLVDEFSRNLLARGIVDQAKLARLLAEMERAFPDAWGIGYEPLISTLTLPDPGDRHVLALAVSEVPGLATAVRARADGGRAGGARVRGGRLRCNETPRHPLARGLVVV